MHLQTGQVLQSPSSTTDDYFDKAIICITEHNIHGSVGFIINRLFPRTLNELQEFAHLSPFPLYEGGPVGQSHLYFLYKRPDIIKGGIMIQDGICFGGDFKQAVQGMEERNISPADIRIFVGYCGWDAGELEAEIEEGEWSLTTFNLFTL